MPQALTGSRKSTPKVVRINADDGDAVVYKNLGNGRRIPFLWGAEVTLASGTTSIVVASGVEFNDHEVAGGTVVATPTADPGTAVDYYIEKDTTNNIVSIKATANSGSDVTFDVIIFLGDAVSFSSTDTTQIWS